VQRADPAPRIEGFGATAEITVTDDGLHTLDLPTAPCPLGATADDDMLDVPAQDCPPDETGIHGMLSFTADDTIAVELESTEHWSAAIAPPDGIDWTCTHAYTLVRAQ
jgi:hypothetical protein